MFHLTADTVTNPVTDWLIHTWLCDTLRLCYHSSCQRWKHCCLFPLKITNGAEISCVILFCMVTAFQRCGIGGHFQSEPAHDGRIKGPEEAGNGFSCWPTFRAHWYVNQAFYLHVEEDNVGLNLLRCSPFLILRKMFSLSCCADRSVGVMKNKHLVKTYVAFFSLSECRVLLLRGSVSCPCHLCHFWLSITDGWVY